MSKSKLDIIVAGAGSVGLVTAIALAQAGFKTLLIGPIDERPTARTVALLNGSVRLLQNLGLWDAIAPNAAALTTMRLVDDTGSLFSAPPVDFCASEIGLDAFGYNIEINRLLALLADVAQQTPHLALANALIDTTTFGQHEVTVACNDGTQHQSQLLVAADGRLSLARRTAGIAIREWTYPQVALTAILAHSRPHHGISTEFHTRAGPCTFVPLPAFADAPHRSSLVWMMSAKDAVTRSAMDAETFARTVERAAHSTLGALRIAGPRGQFPMTGLTAQHSSAARLALVGEAAHVFPPIGAQGLNLGFRDVADLVDCLREAPRSDVGAPAHLAHYDRLRRIDIATRTFGVDALNRSLLADMLPVDFLRGAGLVALANFGPLRRAVMQAGVMPGRVPTLMQPQLANSR